MKKQKITTFLWFDGNAEEAMKFYVSVFKDSKIVDVTPGPDGKAMSVTARLAGQQFYALNGGPQHKFTPAISLFVNCKNQKEVDALWAKLVKGGKESRCGWLEDKYGLSWQIIPKGLGKLLSGKHPERAGRAMQAMMKMSKIDLAAMKKAYKGA